MYIHKHLIAYYILPKLFTILQCNDCYASRALQAPHGILQAKILEWVAILFSRGSSQPRDQTQVSYTADVFFTIWATKEALYIIYKLYNKCLVIFILYMHLMYFISILHRLMGISVFEVFLLMTFFLILITIQVKISKLGFSFKKTK